MPDRGALLPPVLVGRALTRDFPARGRVLRAVRGIDIAVARREIVAIVGESGCGKSTLARMLLGLLPPTSGAILVQGRPPAELGRRGLAPVVQPVFQDPTAALNPCHRVGAIIRLPLDVHGIGPRAGRHARVLDLMDRLGLAPALADRFPRALSGGQRQRVALARALIAEPDILICDEPTSALDVSVQAQILNLLQDLQQGLGIGIALISHNLAVVEHIADRVMIMYLGRVVEQGPTRATLRNPAHPYTDRLRRSVLSLVPGTRLPPDGDDLFPDPHDPPAGCAFHPRCPRASALCIQHDPALLPRGAGAVACHHPLPALVPEHAPA